MPAQGTCRVTRARDTDVNAPKGEFCNVATYATAFLVRVICGGALIDQSQPHRNNETRWKWRELKSFLASDGVARAATNLA